MLGLQDSATETGNVIRLPLVGRGWFWGPPSLESTWVVMIKDRACSVLVSHLWNSMPVIIHLQSDEMT